MKSKSYTTDQQLLLVADITGATFSSPFLFVSNADLQRHPYPYPCPDPVINKSHILVSNYCHRLAGYLKRKDV